MKGDVATRFAAAVGGVGLCLLLGIAGVLKPESAEATSRDHTRSRSVQFFVSPQGKDSWSGKLAAPGKDDGPFATVVRARDAVRSLEQTWREPRPVRIVLRGGTFHLDSTLEFGPEDSGSQEAPVIYTAAPGETVILSGGRQIKNCHWGEINGHEAWVLDIPDVKKGQWRFRQLFVDGERRPRTRLPKQGVYQIQSLPGYTGDFLRSPTRKFVYAPGDIVPAWRNLQDVEVVGITRWLDNRLPIQSVDAPTRTVTFDRPSLFALLAGNKPGPCWVENVCEALESPGQWYLDRPGGTLYYLPHPGEGMSSAEIIAPWLTQVVRVVGRAGAPVHDLRFEVLTFAHAEWQPPADYASSLQAGIEVPGAIQFKYAERCAVTGSRVEHIGNYGIEVGVGCADLEFSHDRVTDIGAGEIRIGHFFSWETDDSGRLTERGLQRKAAMPKGPHSRRITVADNEIAHCGRFTPEAVGVFVGDNADNRILHNHIYDLFYSGISVGSVQDFGPAEATNNVVEYNHVHDIGQGLLSDIFALNAGAQVERGGVGGFELTFRRNLIYYSKGPAIGGYGSAHCGQDVCAFDHNLYWNVSGQPVLCFGKNLAAWRAIGQDKNSLIADPLLADPEHGDFRLRPGSPAARIGFRP
jgi:Right handed beta helix region